MTVASSTSKSGPYAGNGATTVFAFAFKVQQAADIRVVRTVTTNGTQVDTTLASGTDYTVAVNADQSTSPGGSVTTTTAPAAGEQITILRNVNATQGASIPNQGGFYPKVVENALDKLTMLVQQLSEESARALKLSVADSITNLQDLLTRLNTAVSDAESAESNAAGSATAAAMQADTATTQAGIATTQAGIATAQATAAANAVASIGFKDVVFISAADSPYTVSQSASGNLISVDTSAGNVIINLPAIAGLSLPFVVGVKKSTSDANTVTLNRGGTDTFDDGTASATISAVSGMTLVPDTDPAPDKWTVVAWGGSSPAQANVWAGMQTFRDSKIEITDDADTTKKLNFQLSGISSGQTRTVALPDRNGTMVVEALGAGVASAATVNLDTATGNLVHITGATAITAITLASGIERDVVFDGALTLTHSANLLLPGAANIATAAGDRATFRGDGAGVVRCMHYTKANGQAVVAPAVGAPSGLVCLATASANNVATVDFTQFIDTTYDEYVIELLNIVPATNLVHLNMRMSKDGGASFLSTGYGYVGLLARSTSGTPLSGNATGATEIQITFAVYQVSNNAAGGGYSGTIKLMHPASTTTYKTVLVHGSSSYNGGTDITYVTGSGLLADVAAVNAVRFYFAAGNIVSGQFKLYGVRKAV